MPRHSPYALSSLTFLASSNQKLLRHLLKKYSSYTNVLFIKIFARFLVLLNFSSRLISSKSISVNFLKLILVIILVYLFIYIFFNVLFLLYKISRFWWAQMESNHRPHAYQACALTIWAMSPYIRVVFDSFSSVMSFTLFLMYYLKYIEKQTIFIVYFYII